MEESSLFEIRCPFCKAHFKRSSEKEKKRPFKFCAYCGTAIHAPDANSPLNSKAALLQEHIPQKNEILGSLGKYLLLQTIGKGGMGEVFLAFDTISGRKIALKRIRPDFIDSKNLKNRFLREARITSQLTHPSIIPIYSIHIENDVIYYTMPYMAGQTLQALLRKANTPQSSSLHDKKTSIPYLLRIFLDVLQAVAYAHSKNVLHRDLKPENIIIGPYGQVTIFDWGLTKILGTPSTNVPEHDHSPQISLLLTKSEKPVGTVPYMAPEKALGKPASKQTDIYALGVILYQILTLKFPFHRKNIKHFLENWQKEELIPPEIQAPYRDIPQALSIIAQKCLAKDPKDRYETCDELISHVENYLEGRSEWFPAKTLSLSCKEDWEFQENILMPSQTAILRGRDTFDWYNVSVSQTAFSENVRIDLTVTLGEYSQGIGLIVGAPDKSLRNHVTDGYWLYLASSKNISKETTLLRSTVCVLETSEIVLEVQKKYQIRLEKMNHTITLYINGSCQFSYESHIPVVGAHVGIFLQDSDILIDSFVVSTSSLSILVNCLAIPDAFLASKAYDRALSEYRRIGESFTGRAEGREAIFRAGISLIEKGKQSCDQSSRETLFDEALKEFEKLHDTPGAPLEYLGKGIVYQTMGELSEEVKCFELAFRRYPKHPLLQVLIEHIIIRMHEGSLHNRVAAYQFVTLVLQYIPEETNKPMCQKLFHNLKRNWEHIPFFIPTQYSQDPLINRLRLSLCLSFWLQKIHIVSEIFQMLLQIPILPVEDLTNCCLLLASCNQGEGIKTFITAWEGLLSSDEKEQQKHLFSCLLLPTTTSFDFIKKVFTETTPATTEAAVLFTLMNQAAQAQQHDLLLNLYSLKDGSIWSPDLEEYIDSLATEGFLHHKNFEKVLEIFSRYPTERLRNQQSPLFFLYGIYLAATSSIQEAYKHFDTITDTSYPRSWELAAHVIMGKVSIQSKKWLQRTFPYEQATLLRHLIIYASITKDFTYTPLIASLS